MDPRSQHAYLYAHGNPLANFDPTGLATSRPDEDAAALDDMIFQADFVSATEEAIDRISDELKNEDVKNLDQVREGAGNPCYPVVCIGEGVTIREGETERDAEIRALQQHFRGLDAHDAGLIADSLKAPGEKVVGNTVQVVLAQEHVELIEERIGAKLRERSAERIASQSLVEGKGTVAVLPGTAKLAEAVVIGAQVYGTVALGAGVWRIAAQEIAKRAAARGVLLGNARDARFFGQLIGRGGSGQAGREGGAPAVNRGSSSAPGRRGGLV